MKRASLVVLAFVVLCFTSVGFASKELTSRDPFIQPLLNIIEMAASSNLGWKVGDKLEYNLVMKPIPTTMSAVIEVTNETPKIFTIRETVDLKVMKQVIETDMDKDTGAIVKMRVNGKEQAPPANADSTHVVKMEEAHIKVPAGEFDCIYVVAEDADKNQIEQWINPLAIPVSGMLQSKQIIGSYITEELQLRTFTRGK
jgi:hypothetical protein